MKNKNGEILRSRQKFMMIIPQMIHMKNKVLLKNTFKVLRS